MISPNLEESIQVVFCCDANYVMPLAVAMSSVAARCDPRRTLVFSVFQTGIDSHARARVERSVARTQFPNVRIDWKEAPVERFQSARIVNKWLTPAALVRLLLPDLMSTEVCKVIYLDCDVVANDDLAELWDMPLQSKSIMAARDTIGYVSNPDCGLLNYKELRIPADSKYFNSGVLVINLEKWRQRRTSERLLQYMEKYREIIRYEDQEALNAVLFDDWVELDFRWNWQIVWRGVRIGTHKPGWEPDRSRKSIVHFITGEKPWSPGCDYPERELFFAQLDRTDWAGWRVPWHREMACRLLRPLGDFRNALGRMRRRSSL